MDSKRLLHFTVEKKLKELPASNSCIQDILKGKKCVKKILAQNSLEELTALCDLLTIMISAVDDNQRYNKKPIVGVAASKVKKEKGSNQDISHEDKLQHAGFEQDNMDQDLLNLLEMDFKKSQKTASDLFVGNA
jgi:hypothetical protein